jgi:hypothetical protein
VDRLLIARPAEPKDANGEADPSSDDFRETPFRDRHVVVCSEFPVVSGLADEDQDAGEQLSDDHAEKGKTADAEIHVVDALENEGIGGQEEVQEAVNEGHVYGKTERKLAYARRGRMGVELDVQQNDRLRDQHPERSREILLHQLTEINLNLFLLGVDTPVLGSATKLRCLRDEDDRWVRFVEEEEVKGESREAHNTDNVFSPAPAEIRHDNEATDEGCHERTSEDHEREDCNCHASRPVVEHV